MKFKVNDDGLIEAKDGLAIVVDDDGNESTFDLGQTLSKISALNKEAKGHREGKQALESQLKELTEAYKGIDDPEKARTALQTIANLNDKKLVDAGEVARVKDEAVKALREQMTAERDEWKTKYEKEIARYQSEKITNAFATSQTLKKKAPNFPVDMLQKAMADSFKVEDGEVRGYHNGQVILSKTNYGEPASFDEAIEFLVSQRPDKDRIFIGTDASGGGAQGSGTRSANYSNAPKSYADCKTDAEKVAYLESRAK